MILQLNDLEYHDLKRLLAQTVTQSTPNLNSIHQKLFNPKLHPTEQKYPEQCKRFREIVDEMYQMHLKKNQDYSPYNINATGLVGLMTRFWDKTARLMNLIGFDIATGEYSGMKAAAIQTETIIDTFSDAGVYSIIARIWWEGKWGK